MFFSSCLGGDGQKATVKPTYQPVNTNASIPDFPTGIWHYTAYIDSTIFYKSIFKYAWTFASFAYEVAFDTKQPDSCYFKGYHEDFKLPLKKVSNYVYQAGDTVQYYVLTFENNFSQLKIKEYHNNKYWKQKADPATYIYKRADKNIKSLSKYFIDNILKDKYIASGHSVLFSDSLISKDDFSDYYGIYGIDSAATYEVVIDFWEMVPQMDLINLFDKSGHFIKQYNWSFIGGKLILRNVHNVYKDGDKVVSNSSEGDFAGGEADDIAYEFEKAK